MSSSNQSRAVTNVRGCCLKNFSTTAVFTGLPRIVLYRVRAFASCREAEYSVSELPARGRVRLVLAGACASC